MSSRRLVTIALCGAAFIGLILVVSLLLSTGQRQPIEFALPPEVSPTAAPGENANLAGIRVVTVNTETVQDVIATLERPARYTRDLRVESFWDGGSATYNFTTAVSDGRAALRTVAGSAQKNIVVKDGTAYIWYAGDSRAVAVPADSPDAPDEYQMLLTYEDILELEPSSILGAELLTDGDMRLFVRYIGGELGYITECCVSVALGLLVS
ncbi:MAG: hypothetical protein LBT36_06280, partial [Oscillospiraceae bacterium]|nr:hypothetical protein [Oscillospiraceae bacterium]